MVLLGTSSLAVSLSCAFFTMAFVWFVSFLVFAYVYGAGCVAYCAMACYGAVEVWLELCGYVQNK